MAHDSFGNEENIYTIIEHACFVFWLTNDDTIQI